MSSALQCHVKSHLLLCPLAWREREMIYELQQASPLDTASYIFRRSYILHRATFPTLDNPPPRPEITWYQLIIHTTSSNSRIPTLAKGKDDNYRTPVDANVKLRKTRGTSESSLQTRNEFKSLSTIIKMKHLIIRRRNL